MSEDTVQIGPHRRFVFTTNGVRLEQEVRAEVGTKWVSKAFLDKDELRQLKSELGKREIV